jgi:Fic family protein
MARFFTNHSFMTGREFQSLSGMTERTAQRYIKKLVQDGILQPTGHPRSPLYTFVGQSDADRE